jgi:crotonobetainyl-CoA:carnitine CoA-transferase CaiB-like acyl-CoA transferase
MINSNVYCNSDDAFRYEGKPPRQVPDQAQLGLEATYRLYEASEGWVFLDARFDADFVRLCRALGREDLGTDKCYSTWTDRIDNSEALGAELEPLFMARTAEAWENYLLGEGIACVRADKSGHLRFLHSDPQTEALGFLVRTQSAEFADKAPGGGYWRHAPVVKFSETHCAVGLPYESQGAHTRQVLNDLGYDDAAIESLAEEGAIAVKAKKLEPIIV